MAATASTVARLAPPNAPAERYLAAVACGVSADRSGVVTVSDALEGYFRGDSAAAAVRCALQSGDRCRGWAPGELVELAYRAEKAASAAALEVVTKSAATPEKTDTYKLKYALLKLAQWILPSKRYETPERRGYRTADCLRYVNFRAKLASGGGDFAVDVVRSSDDPKARPRLNGLVLCGSVWACPVCASKITEGRRREVRHAVEQHRAQGGEAYLITLTFPHGRMDRLVSEKNAAGDRVGPLGSFDALRAALRKVNAFRAMKDCKERAGFVGSITAKEVTYGLNGWHPHAHSLWFAAAGNNVEALQAELSTAWRRACVLAGLDEPSSEYGLKVSVANVDEYVSKWGADAELTKWHMKRGRPDLAADRLSGLTPWDLLSIAGESAPVFVRKGLTLMPARSANLFREFVDATHGSAQLFWSRGLKDRYGVREFSDAELAERREADEELLGSLTFNQWRAIDRTGRLPEFMALVESAGFAAALGLVEQWRAELRARSRVALRSKMRWDGLRPVLFGR